MRFTALAAVVSLLALFSCKSSHNANSITESADSQQIASEPSPEDIALEAKGAPQPTNIAPAIEGDYQGTRFSDVWAAVKSDPYDTPHYAVTLTSFGVGTASLLRKATKRTLADENDLLPKYRKLIRPNGVCLAGSWHITEANPYSGYFKKGSEGLVIARASVGFTKTERGDYRAFGMGVKLYPTTDKNDKNPLKTANFFVIDDNGGTKKGSFVDADAPAMSNKPPFRPHITLGSAGEIAIQAVVKIAQELADSDSGERQLYLVSRLGETQASVKTPKFIKIYGASKLKEQKPDFRDELATSNFDGPLHFAIEVGDDQDRGMTKIGEMIFDDSVISDTCDHSLHFHHPRNDKNLQ